MLIYNKELFQSLWCRHSPIQYLFQIRSQCLYYIWRNTIIIIIIIIIIITCLWSQFFKWKITDMTEIFPQNTRKRSRGPRTYWRRNGFRRTIFSDTTTLFCSLVTAAPTVSLRSVPYIALCMQCSYIYIYIYIYIGLYINGFSCWLYC